MSCARILLVIFEDSTSLKPETESGWVWMVDNWYLKRVTDTMFIKAARALASIIHDGELAEGRIYPSLKRIHEVSHAIAVAVAEEVYAKKLNTHSRPEDLAGYIHSQMFRPEYPDYTAF